MSNCKLVRIGLPRKARDGSHQDEGLTGKFGFEMRVNEAERAFLDRLVKRAQVCSVQGQGLVFVQDMEESA